jgi:sterol desaturase/sphingolipid hydroxylase (fatty acid hydroxylase superfamily)
MLPWTFGWVGRWLLISPVAHRIHHSPEVEHFDRNFGGITPLWDRLFGTWYAGDRVNEQVGCVDNHYNQASPPRELWVAYQASVTEMVRREKKSA